MAGKLDARQKVIDLARTFNGSHYLWGSAGATPGFQDGSPHRPGSVSLARPSLDPHSPCLNAAQCSVSGYYVCAGRCVKAHGPIVQPSDLTGRWNLDLGDFLTTFRAEGWKVYMLGYADEKRSYFLNLTPRVVIGSNIDERYQGRIVWGEDCRWKRHFDCIGFINYVFNKTAPNIYSKDKLWSANIEQWVNSTQEVNLDSPAVPGDILFRGGVNKKTGTMEYHHIALLAEDNYVVQAEQAVTGVHDDSPYIAKEWDFRRRLGDQFFP